jgi:hypothetical protein
VVLAEGPERDGASQHQLVIAFVVSRFLGLHWDTGYGSPVPGAAISIQPCLMIVFPKFRAPSRLRLLSGRRRCPAGVSPSPELQHWYPYCRA